MPLDRIDAGGRAGLPITFGEQRLAGVLISHRVLLNRPGRDHRHCIRVMQLRCSRPGGRLAARSVMVATSVRNATGKRVAMADGLPCAKPHFGCRCWANPDARQMGVGLKKVE